MTLLLRLLFMRARTGLLSLSFVVLAGCAHQPPPGPPPLALLHDDLFAAPAVAVRDDVFALSHAMQRYLVTDFNVGALRRDPRQALLNSLYGNGNLRLSYDASRTRTAAEAFEARSGNCLSLVIMTAAFAKRLNLPVSYRAVLTDDLYSRRNGLVLANAHVYLVLDMLPVRGEQLGPINDALTVDFLPPQEAGAHRSISVSEKTIVAMYQNNRAAEALADGRVDDSYAWARAAVLQDPDFTTAANTLAVVYMRRGHLPQAEAALQFALQRDADSTAALSNLRLVLQGQGRSAEAQAVAQRLLALQPVAPFHDYELGRLAMNDGNFKQASDLFKRELRRQPHQSEVHFWAAQAQWQLGDHRGAAEHLKRAADTSPTPDTRDLYGAKLEYLKSLHLQ